MRQYGRALNLYRELLEFPRDEYVDDLFLGRIWNNLGSCYARMFQTKRAFEAYSYAYSRAPEEQILKQMYWLTKLDRGLKLGERLRALITEEKLSQWDQSMDEAREQAVQSEAVKQMEEIFGQDEEVRREKESELLHNWKQEYRGMI